MSCLKTVPMSDPLILPLAATDASLALVGGKGRSLARLAAAGLPVPAGFLITTRAYVEFVVANGLQHRILELISDASVLRMDSAESASSAVRQLFESAVMPSGLEAAIRRAYDDLGAEPAVAVRSSATAEDLPEMSFAGQQDSFLNVRGADALVRSVVDCWASLWTARAISYRSKMSVDHGQVAMGVVVQEMVDATVSGVLFTANPTSGERSEIVVNASFGLGESVVGGQITPDTFVLDRAHLERVQFVAGSRQTMVVAAPEQGTRIAPIPPGLSDRPSLSDEILKALALLAIQVEALSGGEPQDIEWAVEEDQCWLLQARPITNLPAPPLRDVQWVPPAGMQRLVRRQVVENMPGPLSPLFEDLYLGEGLDRGMDALTRMMGLPIDLDDFITRPMFVTVNGYGYCRYDLRFSWRMLILIPRMLWWYVTALPGFLRNLVPLWREQGLPAYLDLIEKWKSIEPATAGADELLAGVRTLSKADAAYWFYITMMVGAAKLSEELLDRLLRTRALETRVTSGRFLSGFPSRTLEAQESLGVIADRIAGSASLCELVRKRRAGELIEAFAQDPLGGAIVADIARHLDIYGHQVYSLDFAEPTQAENPVPVLLSLKELVNRPDAARSGQAARVQLAREREALVAETAAAFGPIRRWLFRKFLSWAQRFGPNREEALFYMGAAWPVLRRLALELGNRLVTARALTAAEDVFYLRGAELQSAVADAPQPSASEHLHQAAEDRRRLREARRRLHPPGRVPEDLRFKFGPFDMTRFFEVWETQKLNTDEGVMLQGFPVSPGQVTGTACVILSPADFDDMQPDAILVCATTTPAWTPLFGQAAGLVTDIGGVLAHGSIVAREYGIPAVLGAGNATRRIRTGQRIQVDGDAGTVTLLSDPDAAP